MCSFLYFGALSKKMEADLNDSFQKVSVMKVLYAITDLMLYFRYVRTPAKERYSNPLTWKVCITTV